MLTVKIDKTTYFLEHTHRIDSILLQIFQQLTLTSPECEGKFFTATNPHKSRMWR